MTTKTRSSNAAFVTARILASRLTVLDREITSPGDKRWDEFWQVASRLEAVENSARRATGWRGCIFGPGARCPESLPVNCQSCAGEPSGEPEPVLTTRYESDPVTGERLEVMTLDF